MTHSMDTERADFEAVASDYGECPKAIERDAKGNYLLMHTATGWMWWQAARRAPAAPVPQGWKLVPVEPTKEMLSQFDELFINGRVSSFGEFLVSVPSHDCNIPVDSYTAKEIYDYMLTAAPQPPEETK